MARPIAAVLLLLLMGGPANAAEPVDAGWIEVARGETGDCTLSVTGNGRFYRIAASGLGPGAPGRFVVSNGDMKPLDWSIRATAGGDFARYYLPFRWHRDGDPVTISLASERCNLVTGFSWRRAAVDVR